MAERPDEAHSLASLAAGMGLTQHAFLRRFAHTFGVTPHAYLTHLRLERAKALLARDELSVTDVCAEVGFESLGSFSTLFARRVGDSPLRYRQSQRRWVQVPDWVLRAAVPACFFGRF